jgi:hypothetical protein
MDGIVLALGFGLVATVLVLVREVRLRRALQQFVRMVLNKERRP